MLNPKLSKKAIEDLLDKKFRQAVKAIAGYKCEKCGFNGGDWTGVQVSSVLEAHHVFSRNNKSTRWDVKNGICLCKRHHQAAQYSSFNGVERFSAHGTPAEFMDWIEEYRGSEWLDKLRIKTHTMQKFLKEDYQRVCDELDAIIDQYGKTV